MNKNAIDRPRGGLKTGILCLALTFTMTPHSGQSETTPTGLSNVLGLDDFAMAWDGIASDQTLTRHQIKPSLTDEPTRSDSVSVSIFQDGLNHTLQLQGKGRSNTISILQKGEGNSIDGHVAGHENTAIVAQFGRLNAAQFTQSGVMNTVSIQQGTW